MLASLRSAEKKLLRPLSDDEELLVAAARAQAAGRGGEAFRAGDRPERAAREEAELKILEEYMPPPLSQEELEEIVDKAVAAVGATNVRDLGRVMADVMPQVSGRADGSLVSQLVREALA